MATVLHPNAVSLPSPADVARRREETVREIIKRGLMSDEHPLCGVLDLDTLDELIAALGKSYPGRVDALHTVAAKAIAMPAVLRHFAAAGMGCEVASPGELHLALAAGFPTDRIILDSPAKTLSEISQAVRLGVRFNIDSFEELHRVDRLLATWDGPLPVVGVRVNPQSGAGSIEAMSTATATSKFGIGLTDFRVQIVEAFRDRPWLRQLHVHSGSQGVPLAQTAGDVAAVVALAEEIERVVGYQQVETIDVGGGLSVNFGSDQTTPTFADHAEALVAAAPVLFSGKYRLATEFGRSLTAKAGMLIGRVEYVKQAGERTVAVTHVGVHVAARTVFMPQAWPLRIEVYTPAGRIRTGPMREFDIAGPACFTGDVIATQRRLPEIASGDYIAVPDTGGYYFSNHFSYNSLARPAVYATRSVGARRDLLVVRRPQPLHDVLAESGEREMHPVESEPTDGGL